MAFYVGQKVVCVDAAGSRQLLRQGEVYTVSKLGFLSDGTPGIDVAEETEPCPHDVGWRRSRFRPVVEREYDISIFKAMLNPAKKAAETVGVLTFFWGIMVVIQFAQFAGGQ